MLSPFERGLVAHLIADWVLQNDWMARNKSNLVHPAALVHFLINAVLMGLALGWIAGLILGAVHVLIDTRLPMEWWRGFFRQTADGPYGVITAVWADQVLHITAIAAWVMFAFR